jgi:FAD/FMN-containing dehydrogenase
MRPLAPHHVGTSDVCLDHAVSGATRYANYLEDDTPDPAAVAYGSNLPRLRAIKAKYDSKNLFSHNVNIVPA